MKTLLILAHPDMENSVANKIIVEQVQASLADVTVRDISRLYPDFDIDADAEQAALLEHDAIVFQYPFYWYSMPAILKHWFDVVFTYQFAYGSQGDKLKDKLFQASFTVGAAKMGYQPLGDHHFYVPEFCKGLEQTAYLAQMKYQQPVYSFGHSLNAGHSVSEVEVNARSHARSLLERLASF